MRNLVLFLFGLSAIAIAAPPQKEPLAPYTPEKDLRGSWDAKIDPKLPNVLILGDSISISYTRAVRHKLEGKANVLRPMRADGRGADNCGDTIIGLANIERWLGEQKWDVIHFNWGLWDLCYRHPESKTQGNRDKVKGRQSVPPAAYEQNLEKLVARLQQTGAKLIWASTTVVPDGEVGRFTGDDRKYNEVAARVMKRHNIAVNDLHALSANFTAEMFSGPGDVHFSSPGVTKLADQVADKIAVALDDNTSVSRTTPDSNTKRPNILLLFADDLGRYASAYADPVTPSPNDIVKTPAFDRVAHEGALFQNAFVSAPSCTPSRASLNTGRHFFRNGSHSQLHSPWPKDAPDPFSEVRGMAATLQESGYHIGHSLKLHITPRLIGGKENIYDKQGGKINEYSENLTKATDKQAEKEKILTQVRGNFRDFLAKRKNDQPFYYSFNPTNTHRKWVAGSGKALWGLNPDDLKGKLPPVLPDVPLIREDVADYLGEAMAFDAACGELIRMVEEMGELDNTIIVISGDHGIPGMPRGKTSVHDLGSRVLLAIRWPAKIAPNRNVKSPVSLIDIAPTLLAAASLKSPDDPDGENLLTALAPGADDSKLRGWALIGREVHCHPAREENLPYPVRAIRTPDFLYVRNFKPDRWPMGAPYQVTENSAPTYDQLANNTYCAFPDMDSSPTKAWLVEHRKDADMKTFIDFAWGKRPAEELYDLRKDPHQMKNLTDDAAYRETLDTLRRKLMNELTAKKDPRVVDNDAFDRQPYMTRRK